MGSKSLTILQLFFDTKFYEQNFLLWPNVSKKSWSAHVELCVIQFSDCYVEPGQRYSMISETLPNWGGLKVENFGGKFKFQNLISWNTLSSTLSAQSLQSGIKFAQNATRNPLAWGFKLANSETSCDKIESGQLYPSEIWQPWCPIFGNPENKIVFLQVFEHA